MTTKWMQRVLLLVMILFVAGALAFAADTPGKGAVQEKCPVLAGTIDKSIYTDYQGKRVYFCCAGCIDEFKKDPEKYMKKLKEEGAVLEDAPKSN